MKRLLAYLFIVIGFGLTFSVNGNAKELQYCAYQVEKASVYFKKKNFRNYECYIVKSSENANLYNAIQSSVIKENGEYRISSAKIYKFIKLYPDGACLGSKQECVKFKGALVSKEYYCRLVFNKISNLVSTKKYRDNCINGLSKDTIQIAKKEPTKKKKVVKKETTNVSNSKKIKKIIKIDNKEPVKENISSWEKNVLAAIDNEKNDTYCEVKDKISLKSLSSSKEKNVTKSFKKNYCIKKSDLLQLGEFKKLNLPNFIMNEIKGCQTNVCIGQHAGKKVYEYFVRRGPIYHARYPGKMINGMVWFEILYYEKFRKLQKILKRYEENKYEGIYKLKKANHEKQIYSLIKLNKGRIKMRKALGFTLYDDTIKVIESQWLLAEFLNKDKLTVSRVKLSPEMHKRKLLIEKYKTLLAKYKKKLEEEKAKKNKS